MPFELDVDLTNKIITATYSGPITLHLRMAVVKAVMQQLEEHPRFGVLIDTTQGTDTLTEEEHMVFGAFLAERGTAYLNSRVAVLDTNQKRQQLAISVAYAGGFPKMVQFHNRQEAIRWLKISK